MTKFPLNGWLKTLGRGFNTRRLERGRKDNKMNCKNEECQTELSEFADDSEFYEVCADCYDNLRSGNLETQLERTLTNA